MITCKRIYNPPEDKDGYRILVDRLWPRGISKEGAGIDLWLKEIAPSDVLRKWFAHDVNKWELFKEKYSRELKEKKELIAKISQLEKEHGKITLLYAAKDELHNNAVVLKDFYAGNT